MIHISKIEKEQYEEYDYIRCPKCGKGRLCDKPRGAKVSLLHIDGKGLDHVVVKCPCCSSRYLITADN